MLNKILFPLFVFVLLTNFSFSQNSYLQLSLYDDADFSVLFDNTELSPGNYAEFDNISAGEHKLKIVKQDPSILQQSSVIFDGSIKIPAGFDIYAVIDEYNAFTVYKKKRYGINRYIPVGQYVRKCGEAHNYTDKDKQKYSDECSYKIMKKDDFKDLKGSINNRSFESTNLDIAKTAIDNNYLSSEQVRELMSFFTFETNKLEIAKYSYKKVCDPGNFFKVYDVFDFESSVTELKDYISKK